MTIPSSDVISAIEAGVTRVTRRLEIFEGDGATPWNPPYAEDIKFKMLGGAVSVDSTRDERRTIDLTLDNKDGALRPNADRGFWYDKVLKVHRGVRFETRSTRPKILIVEHVLGDDGARRLKALLARLGHTNVSIDLSINSANQLGDAKIIISAVADRKSSKAQLLLSAFARGTSVMTMGVGNDETVIPYATGSQPHRSGELVTMNPVNRDTPLAGVWGKEDLGPTRGGRMIVDVTGGAVVVARSLNDGYNHVLASVQEGERGRWFDYHYNEFGPNGRILLANALRWLWRFTPYTEWSTQLGEFVIDSIKNQRFPATVSVTGRDYTKFCLTSKIERDMSFDSATSVNTLITSLAANAGVRKISMPTGLNVALGTRIDVAKGTERWNVMKQASDAHGYQLLFSPEGFLTARPYADPATGSPDLVLRVGGDGNLSEYAQQVSDARIYNNVVVTGNREGNSELLPFHAQVRNTNPNSPTSIGRIGDRTYFYESSFFTGSAQTYNYAYNLLKRVALEQYELDFSSIVYPWLDAGSVVGFADPDATARDPDRYLMDTLTIPLALEPMSGTGKRVLFIGNFSG